MMKVVFLDIDGILNPLNHFDATGVFYGPACQNLEKLLDSIPGLKVVVSSSWRRLGIEKDKEILRRNKIEVSRVIGRTDPAHKSKGHQIHQWLLGHPEVKDFVILDDEDDQISYFGYGPRFVKPNSFIGLTSEDAKKVIDLFGKK
jgi:hypothetical protein